MPGAPQGEAVDRGEPRFGFSRDLRLKRGWEFDLVFRTGRRAHGELVRLFFVERPDEPTRVGVTVGRKVGKARASMLDGQGRNHEAVEADFAARRAKLAEGSA